MTKVQQENMPPGPTRIEKLANRLTHLPQSKALSEISRLSINKILDLRDGHFFDPESVLYAGLMQQIIKSSKPPKRIVIRFSRRSIDDQLIRSAMDEAKKHWPWRTDTISKIHVQYKTNVELRHFLCNFNKTHDEESETLCYCSSLPKEIQRADSSDASHVFCGLAELAQALRSSKDFEDIETSQFDNLIQLVQCGGKFRFDLSTEESITNLREDLERVARRYEKCPSIYKKLTGFINEVVDKVSARANDKVPPAQPKFPQALVQRIREMFIVVPVDKAAQTMGAFCKKCYFTLLKQKLHTVFQPIDKTAAERILQDFTSRKIDDENFPYPYLLPKLHKPTMAVRLVVGTHAVVDEDRSSTPQVTNYTSTQARKLDRCLAVVASILKDEARKLYLKDGIQRVQALASTKHVRDFLLSEAEALKGKELRKTDFSAMYNELDAQAVIEGVTWAVEKAFDVLRKMNADSIKPIYAFYKFRGYEYFTPQDLKVSKDAATKDQILSMMQQVVSGSMIKFRDHFFKQTAGLAIGGLASKSLADLYCMAVEWKHMDKMASSELAKKLHGYKYCARYVDDQLCTVEAHQLLPTPEEYKLRYSAKEAGFDHIFCGYRITTANDDLDFMMADKQTVINTRIIRYPHPLSTVPTNFFTGSITSAVYYAQQTSFGKPDQSLQEIFQIILERGYTTDLFEKAFNRYSNRKEIQSMCRAALNRATSALDLDSESVVCVGEKRHTPSETTAVSPQSAAATIEPSEADDAAERRNVTIPFQNTDCRCAFAAVGDILALLYSKLHDKKELPEPFDRFLKVRQPEYATLEKVEEALYGEIDRRGNRAFAIDEVLRKALEHPELSFLRDCLAIRTEVNVRCTQCSHNCSGTIREPGPTLLPIGMNTKVARFELHDFMKKHSSKPIDEPIPKSFLCESHPDKCKMVRTKSRPGPFMILETLRGMKANGGHQSYDFSFNGDQFWHDGDLQFPYRAEALVQRIPGIPGHFLTDIHDKRTWIRLDSNEPHKVRTRNDHVVEQQNKNSVFLLLAQQPTSDAMTGAGPRGRGKGTRRLTEPPSGRSFQPKMKNERQFSSKTSGGQSQYLTERGGRTPRNRFTYLDIVNGKNTVKNRRKNSRYRKFSRSNDDIDNDEISYFRAPHSLDARRRPRSKAKCPGDHWPMDAR